MIKGNATPLSDELKTLLNGRSWQPECPVKLEELSLLTIPHFGFDQQLHQGEMIVHKSLADELIEIFSELLLHKFPIEKMLLVDHFNADDTLSMESNNSYAFCYRKNVTFPALLSKHSYGFAVDINPIQNPYIKGEKIFPQSGKAFIDRTMQHKGMIYEGSLCHLAFEKRGWTWGGLWKDRQDYHHFEKSPHSS